MPKVRAHRAFTLIELLVVIAIIAILAAILFPVFAQAKAAAKAASCLSNMKQVAIAWPMYASDSDDTMPLAQQAYTGAVPAGGMFATQFPLYASWYTGFSPIKGGADLQAGSLQPYMKNTKITDCPDAGGLPNTNGMEPVAYGLNTNLFYGTDASIGDYSTLFQSVNYSKVSATAETLLYGDSATSMYGLGQVQRGGVQLAFGMPCVSTAMAQGRHTNRANLSWLDGHAKSMTVDTSIQKAWKAATGLNSAFDACIKAGIGDILKAPAPAGAPASWIRTPAAAQSGYYYLLNKPS